LRQKRGHFELADHGTLFLDEIGDISPELQPKLLRAFEKQEFERLGSNKTFTSMFASSRRRIEIRRR
jgi:transcriptional regulator with GAF, ATPase, and Fis domain